jgi:hypothetical protein
MLARVLERTGDDTGAENANALARTTLDTFAAGLSAGRRERFLASPFLDAALTPTL